MRAGRALSAALLALGLLAGCGAEPDVVGDVRGVYLFDREDFARRLLAERLVAHETERRVAADEEQRRRWYDEARRTAAATDLRLDLLDEGGFVVRYRFGSEEGRRRGTWHRDGTHITLRTTHTPTGPLPEPSEVLVVWTDGALLCPPSPEVPHAFRLRPR